MHTSTNTLLRVIVAIRIPRHRVAPWPNTRSWTRSICARVVESASNHLSGLKISGSDPNTLLNNEPAMLMPILVPPGTNFPRMVSPSGGTTRSRREVMGGKIRRPSFMHAWRYGSFVASCACAGDERKPLETASSISVFNFV